MNINLTWTTGGGAASQDVQYKLATASTWTTHSNIAGNITTAAISGLQDNLIYDFRVNLTGKGIFVEFFKYIRERLIKLRDDFKN